MTVPTVHYHKNTVAKVFRISFHGSRAKKVSAIIPPSKTPNSLKQRVSSYKSLTNHPLADTRISIDPCINLCRIYHVFCQPFDEMPQRTISFNEILDLIEFIKVRPNVWNAMVVHLLVYKVGFLVHLPIVTSLVIAYSRADCYSASLALFSEIYCKDVVVWNAMMTSSNENGRFRDAMNFFVNMLQEGVKFDSATLVIAISALSKITNKLGWLQPVHSLGLKAGALSDCYLCNALIDIYAKSGDLWSSECMFESMVVKDRISWNSIISGCLNNNHPEKSLLYFKNMVSCGKEVDNVGLSCTIAASACLQDLTMGKVIHGWGIKLGYEGSPHVSVLNALVSLYSQCGDIAAADSVFRGTSPKDLVSWNAMIDGLASNGMNLEAFHLIHEMQTARSVQPDAVTILLVLRLCAELIQLRVGKSIHGFIIREELGRYLSIMNSLLNMYSKCNSLKDAEYVFVTMPEKDLVSWNTVISGYTENGNSRLAQLLFRELLFSCSECSLSTVLAILPSCNSPEFLNFGKSLHGWQLKLGFSNNILAINSLMCMYINSGDLTASYALLQRVWTTADTACWNAIIVGCTQNGYFMESLEIFDLMRTKSHAKHDSITLVSVISACGNLEWVRQGKLSHGFALKTLVDKDIRVQNALITMYGRFGEADGAMSVFKLCCNRNLCSWNCIISALSQNKDSKTALTLFRCLDFQPNEITVATILSACTHLGSIRHGKEIHAHVLRSGFHKNCFITAALVDMYSNCGRLDISLHIFRSSPEKTIASWNSMISAYGFHSDGQKAIDVFNEMIEFGEIPTKTTFINLLSACAHSGLVNEGMGYYNCMLRDFGVEPVTEHHVCVVDMLGRCGRLTEAYEFVERMQEKPEQGVWGALLSACNYHGDVEMGRKVAGILFRLEPENAGYYVSLANSYVAAGRWSDAVKLRTFVHDKRLKKPVGYSLIDVGQG